MKKLYLEPEFEVYKLTIIDSILRNSDENDLLDKDHFGGDGGEDPGNNDGDL